MPRLILLLLAFLLASRAQADILVKENNPAPAPDKFDSAPYTFMLEKLKTGLWNGILFNTQPNSFLVDSVRELKQGKALDVGMGQGRNTIYLSQQGWDVTGFDIDESGVKQAREQAKKLNLKLNALVQSDAEFDFGMDRWDLVVLCYVPFKNMVGRIYQSLKPGGIVIVEDFHRDTRKMRLMYDDSAFASNELLEIFAKFRILRYEDVMAKQDWGTSEGEKNRLVRLIAQKEVANQAEGCSWENRAYPVGGEACWGKVMMICRKKGWYPVGDCN